MCIKGDLATQWPCVFVSISEEEPGPLRSDTEGKGGPKISRTFSYLRSKMSKKGKVRTPATSYCSVRNSNSTAMYVKNSHRTVKRFQVIICGLALADKETGVLVVLAFETIFICIQ